MKKILLAAIILSATKAAAQTDSTKPAFAVSGYLEAYYSYDFGKSAAHNRPAFAYSHNRHNEVNINLGFIKAAYTTKKVRANLALATGTYMNANYAAEPGVLKNIYEANAGTRLSGKKDIWIDAGIFPSHIGFESAVGKDNPTLTRSIPADNSPYFEAGARISYTSANGKWFMSGLLLNGWQRIQRADGNNMPAFGHQLTYKPNPGITLNSSSFIGSDKPDSSRQLRYFHNFYGIFRLSEQWSLTAGFDIGAEQTAKRSSSYHSWYSPVLIAGYSPAENHAVAARVEYYSDANQVIVSTGTVNGFITWGYSLNYDYTIGENVLWRTEARGFLAKDKIFPDGKTLSRNNFLVTTSLALSF